MQKLLCILGLSLTIILPTYADSNLDNNSLIAKRRTGHSNHSNNGYCPNNAAKLYAWSEINDDVVNLLFWEELDVSVYPSNYDYYVPFFFHSVADDIGSIDEATFLILKHGFYQITYTISKDSDDDETAAVFAIEVADELGAQLVPGSTMSFNNDSSSDDPWKTMTVLYYVPQDDTAIRIADIIPNGENVELEPADENGVFASLLIIQLP